VGQFRRSGVKMKQHILSLPEGKKEQETEERKPKSSTPANERRDLSLGKENQRCAVLESLAGKDAEVRGGKGIGLAGDRRAM